VDVRSISPFLDDFLKKYDFKGMDDNRIMKMLLSSLDWSTFAETWFRNPIDPTLPLKLEKFQRRIINYFQYGKCSNIIVKCPRQFGKTTLISILCNLIAIFDPGAKIGLFSTSHDQSKEILGKVRKFMRTSAFSYLLDDKSVQTQTEINYKDPRGLGHGCRIKAYSSSGKTVRGPDLTYTFMDEMGQMDDDFVNQVVRPMGRAVGKKELGASTPFGTRGEFWNSHEKPYHWECQSCHAKGFDEPHPYTCPKCGGSVQTLGQYKVFDVSPLDVSWITPEKLAAEAARLGPIAAQQELFGEFIPAGDTYFRHDWIVNARVFTPEQNSRFSSMGKPYYTYYLSTDYGKQRDRGVIMIGHFQDDVLYLDWVESHLKMPYPRFQDRMKTLCDRYNVSEAILDGNGVGIALIDYLREDVQVPIFTNKPDLGPGYKYGNKEKFQMLEALANMLIRKRVRWPYHENHSDPRQEMYELYMMEQELINYSYEWGKSSIIMGTQSEHDDRVMALAQLVGATMMTHFDDVMPYGASDVSRDDRGWPVFDEVGEEFDVMWVDNTTDPEYEIYDTIF